MQDSHYFRVRSTKHSLLTTMADEEFNKGHSGASTTYPMQCSALRKDGFVMIKDRRCKIIEMNTSMSGKHGHAKVHLVGVDLITGATHEDIVPSTHDLDVPLVNMKDYQAICVQDGYLSLMDDNGDTREDLKVPEGKLGDEITEKINHHETFMVTVLVDMGEEQVFSLKTLY